MHSASRGEFFTVRCEQRTGYIWIEVEDLGGPWQDKPPGDRPHGLDIISALAGPENWGAETTSDGNRIVWARLACRPATQTTPAPEHDHRIAQLTPGELDMYGNQLARCLKALGTNAPIRARIQRELSAVQTELAARAHPRQPGRLPHVGGLTAEELDRTRRELQASLTLARPGSPIRKPILAHLAAIETELSSRAARQPGSNPPPRVPERTAGLPAGPTRWNIRPCSAGEASIVPTGTGGQQSTLNTFSTYLMLLCP